MANNRGSHQGPANQQKSSGSPQQQGGTRRSPSQYEAYDRAYRNYVNQQQASGRASGQHAYRQDGYQQGYGQNLAYGQQYGYAAYGPNGVRGMQPVPNKKGHPIRNTIIVLLLLVLIIGGFAGFTGYRLYNSAKEVKADASAVMADIGSLKDQILAEQPDQANATARDIAKRSENMKRQTSTWEWTVASYIPVYGQDVKMVRELSDVLDDLASNAIVPLVSEVSQVSIKKLLVDGAINVDLTTRMVDAVNSAAPIISRSNAKLQAMGDAHLEQINGPLKKAREKLGKLDTATQFVANIAPTFADMVGANGEPRTYLIVAQNNSEIRSTGGFLGSVGPLYLDNGRIEMGDFRTIYDIYPPENEYAPLTEDEVAVFGTHVGWQIADSNFIPDFGRVGEIVKYAWEKKGYGGVDAVIGVDPVFLQHMLAIAGPVVTSDGTEVNGDNAARLLLHDAYYMDPDLQDPFFEEVAALSFKQLMSHLGDVSLTKLMDVVNKDIDARRLQVYMALPNEEEAVEVLGADGKLSHDAEEPTLGVFFTDVSYSKLFWYMKAETEVGDPVKNADGTTTYPVTVIYRNMLTDEGELSDYMKAHNPIARTPGEMIAWVYLSAPEGGSITDMSLVEGEFEPAGTKWHSLCEASSGTMDEASLQGLDFWNGLTRTLPGESFAISFNVNTAPNAKEPLKVVRTPTAQEVAGW